MPDIRRRGAAARKRFAASRAALIRTFILTAFCAALLMLPDYHAVGQRPEARRVKATVIGVDNASLHSMGLIREGDQYCELAVAQGDFAGETVRGVNRLFGKMEIDKVYEVGDPVLVVLDTGADGALIEPVTMVDHYRLDLEAYLFGGFVLLLVLFAGLTGLNALITFVVTVLVVWKVLVPGLLNGNDPILIALAVTVGLTLVVLYAMGGFTRKATAAACGSLAGTALTTLLAILCGDAFRIHGAIMPFSESLLYSGYAHLDLTRIFVAGVFIASSGALADLSMDIASAVAEVAAKKPDIGRWEAVRSGLTVGRSVIGTMTTTLLLAYSGGYLSLLMVFAAQGTPIINILNLKYVASEILHTVVGSIGLVTVAPLTALMAGLLLAAKRTGGADAGGSSSCSIIAK